MGLPERTGSFAYWLMTSPSSFMLDASLGFHEAKKYMFCLITRGNSNTGIGKKVLQQAALVLLSVSTPNFS